jgi:alpha/beta superfamily hydrolase
MVRKGEYLERAVVIPASHGTLEGLFHRGERAPPLLIVPMHPLQGGSMESAIIAELAWAVTRRGHATLRFNYRGVGASAGAFKEEHALQNARDAAAHLRATVGVETLAIAGIGYGARIARALAGEDPEVEQLIAVAPEASVLDDFSRELIAVIAEQEDPGVHQDLKARAKALPNARVAVIPGADRAFVRGLVELGRVVADAVSPPGNINF